MIRADIVADSINEAGVRLTTFECVVPKWLIAEINTHSVIRRNSASSRAIPTSKIIERVLRDPYVPLEWRYREAKGGMQAGDLMTEENAEIAREEWLLARDAAVAHARTLDNLECAKEHVNRLLEPWMWTVVVMTATEWDNYLHLRGARGGAQPEFKALVAAQIEAFGVSTPIVRHSAYPASRQAWHLPYVSDDERVLVTDWRVLPKLSAARCAGVSYYRPGAHGALLDEVARADRLVVNGHWSPLDMPCFVMPGAEDWYGSYRGWKPLRKFYGGESGSLTHGTQEDATWMTA